MMMTSEEEDLAPVVLPPIGIMGPSGHGKTTLARILANYGGYSIFPFAQPIKDMMSALGLSEDDVSGSMKETPHPVLCGQTPRHAMQTLGTEWGRGLMGDGIWLRAWRYRVEGSPIKRAIADDCRFINEALLIRELGGTIWRIVDPRKQIPAYEDAHASEIEWTFIDPDVEIINDGTQEDLHRKVAFIMENQKNDSRT